MSYTALALFVWDITLTVSYIALAPFVEYITPAVSHATPAPQTAPAGGIGGQPAPTWTTLSGKGARRKVAELHHLCISADFSCALPGEVRASNSTSVFWVLLCGWDGSAVASTRERRSRVLCSNLLSIGRAVPGQMALPCGQSGTVLCLSRRTWLDDGAAAHGRLAGLHRRHFSQRRHCTFLAGNVDDQHCGSCEARDKQWL